MRRVEGGASLVDGFGDRNLSLLEEGRRLVEAAEAAGILLRLLGGVAILDHCPMARGRGGSRPIADLDAVVGRGQARALGRFLGEQGYRPEVRFNALHGHHRMIFHGPLGRLDVMVGAFVMCHRLDLEERLTLDRPTLPVTDLLVTKLQVVQLNEKDATDAVDLLAEHELDRAEGDVVNLAYLESLVARDWGLWRTMSGTLARLRDLSPPPGVRAKVAEVQASLDRVPKSLRFRLRAKVGERIPWYQLPDEVE